METDPETEGMIVARVNETRSLAMVTPNRPLHFIYSVLVPVPSPRALAVLRIPSRPHAR